MEQPLNLVGYIRVSTDKQDISPEVQRAQLEAEAARSGAHLTIVEELAVSAATISKRPLMQQVLADLKAKRYDGLMVSKLDRLSRSVADGAKVLADSERQGWRLICLDLGVDTATMAGSAMVHVALTFSELERKAIGERTRVAMQQRRSQGHHMGRRSELEPATRELIHQLREDGLSLRKIADQLTAQGIETPRGGKWYASSIKAVLESATSERQQA